MNIISEISRGVWMMQPEAAKIYFPIVHNLLSGINPPDKTNHIFSPDNTKEPQAGIVTLEDLNSTTGVYQLYEEPESIQENSIFSLDIVGPITKYDQFCGSYGMKTKSQWLKQADKHPNIIAHIIRIDSGGGEGYAARFMATTISELKKPVIAYVEGMAASAAYWIASACDQIVVSDKMTRVGSIGTYITVADYSAWYHAQGIKVYDLYAKDSKDKNKDYLEAIAGNTQRLQAVVDQFNDHFLAAIDHNRADNLTNDDWTTGDMFFAPQALTIGLIDHIASFDYLVENLVELTNPE